MAASDPAPATPPLIDSPASVQGGKPPERAASRRPPRRILGVMLLMGGLAGVASGLLIDRTHGILMHRSEFLRKMQAKGLGVSPEELVQFIAAKRMLRHLDTALTIGLAGLVFCTMFGLGRGILAGSWRTAAFAMAGGAIGGGALGAAGGFAEAILDSWFAEQRQLDPMYLAMIKHGVAWTTVAVAVGLTGVLPAQRSGAVVHTILPVIAAGIAAAIAFVPISAVLFPIQIAEFAVPLGLGNRILWTCLPAVLMALVVGRTLSTNQAEGVRSSCIPLKTGSL